MKKSFANNESTAIFAAQNRDVAQPGSALVWGARGRKFKSCHPDKYRSRT